MKKSQKLIDQKPLRWPHRELDVNERLDRVTEDLIGIVIRCTAPHTTRAEEEIKLIPEVMIGVPYPFETQPEEKIKHRLLNASYLARPEGKIEVDLLNVTYLANPEESTDADWLYNFCPDIPKPEVEVKKEPQETIDTRQYSLVMSHKVREPSIFYETPEEDGQNWLTRFEIVATANGWGKEQKASYVKLYLEGKTRSWIQVNEPEN